MDGIGFAENAREEANASPLDGDDNGVSRVPFFVGAKIPLGFAASCSVISSCSCSRPVIERPKSCGAKARAGRHFPVQSGEFRLQRLRGGRVQFIRGSRYSSELWRSDRSEQQAGHSLQTYRATKMNWTRDRDIRERRCVDDVTSQVAQEKAQPASCWSMERNADRAPHAGRP